MKSTRKMQASTEIFEQIIDHATSQQVANYAFANTLAKTFLMHGTIDKNSNTQEFNNEFNKNEAS